MYHFRKILHAFQYTTTKMIIFCASKTLLNNKKSLKGYQDQYVKWSQNCFCWKKTFLRVDLETSWYRSCGCCDNSQSCEHLKKCVTEKCFPKRRDFEPKSPSFRGNVCYLYNSWVTGVYMACIFQRNSGGETSQIEWLFESNLRSFGCSKCFAGLWLPLYPSCKGNSLTKTGWVVQAQIVTWHPN